MLWVPHPDLCSKLAGDFCAIWRPKPPDVLDVGQICGQLQVLLRHAALAHAWQPRVVCLELVGNVKDAMYGRACNSQRPHNQLHIINASVAHLSTSKAAPLICKELS